MMGYVNWGGKERSSTRSFEMRFRRKRNPETYPCLPNSLRSSGSCPTVYRVQWYPEIIISELAPDFDVRGVYPQVVGEDCIDVAGDGGAALAEDAGEGLPVAISRVSDQPFPKIKIIVDVSLVALAVMSCYIFWGSWQWNIIGPGTLFAMFYIGYIVKLLSRHLGWFDRLLCRPGMRRYVFGLARYLYRRFRAG